VLNAAVDVKPSSTEGLGIFVTREFARGEVIRQVQIVSAKHTQALTAILNPPDPEE